MATERHLAGKRQAATKALREYEEYRARRPEHCPEALWQLHAPPPEQCHRWRVQLSCGCIREVLARSRHNPPLGPYLDRCSRCALPVGQIACCSDRSDDEHPRHYQEIVDWVERTEVTFPADPIEPPDYPAGLSAEIGLWEKVRRNEPVTCALWKVELACGHFGEQSAPSLEWRPGDPPTTVSDERAAEMTADWEDHYAKVPLSKFDSEAERAHRRRMLALRWPSPEPELDCWPCSYTHQIEAYEYVGPLAKPAAAMPTRNRAPVLPSYRSHGGPLESYELTSADHRSQKDSECIRASVRDQMRRWRAEEAASPELRDRQAAKLTDVWTLLAQHQTTEDEIVRWRVRLYCGHIVTTTRHFTAETPTKGSSSSMRCPTCGMDPAVLVAYEPIDSGPRLPDDAHAVESAPPKRRTRKQLEARIAELEGELDAKRRVGDS